jgi:hypothetical protein
MTNDTQVKIDSLLRMIALNQGRVESLIKEHGYGCRPSYVSEELCHYGERVERYKAELNQIKDWQHYELYS